LPLLAREPLLFASPAVGVGQLFIAICSSGSLP
jgi:hypothetical protein